MVEDSKYPRVSIDALRAQLGTLEALHATLPNYLASRKASPGSRFTADAEFVAYAERWLYTVPPEERLLWVQRHLSSEVPPLELPLIASHCALLGSADSLVRAAGRLLRPDAGLAEIAAAATILETANTRNGLLAVEEELAGQLIACHLEGRYVSLSAAKFYMPDALTLLNSFLPGVGDSASCLFDGEYQDVTSSPRGDHV